MHTLLLTSVTPPMSQTVTNIWLRPLKYVTFYTFGAEGRWFDSTSSRHVGTLGKSFTRNCLYDGRGAVWLHALLLNSTPVIRGATKGGAGGCSSTPQPKKVFPVIQPDPMTFLLGGVLVLA